MFSFDDLSVEDFINDIEENNTNKKEKSKTNVCFTFFIFIIKIVDNIV